MFIGDVNVEPVSDGVGRALLRVAWAHPAVEGRVPKGSREADWDDHREFLDASGFFVIPIGGFLVRAAGRVILVDVGMGMRHDSLSAREAYPETWLWYTGSFIEDLARLGVEPTDVTDVVFSHLHYDHIGWASRDGLATFPNATYRCDILDWEYFLPDRGAPGDKAPERLREPPQRLLGPVADRMELWHRDGPIVPGVDVLRTPGHTPGSSVVVISSRGERGILVGDTVHCPIQLLDQEWGAIAAVDHALARSSREALAREMENTTTRFAGPHFPGMQFGRLLTADGHRRWIVE